MKRGIRSIGLIMLVLFMVVGVTGCGVLVSEDSVAGSVEKQGYRNVQIISKHIFFVEWRGCGKGDAVAFKATAINPIGQRVDLTVCSGWPFKGVTIRT